MARSVGERIFQVPEAALDVPGLDFEVADRGAQARIPVHQALVAIEQALPVQLDEHLENGLGKALVHGEALVGPVHRAAEAAELLGNLAAALLLPLPDLGDELLAREVGALLLPEVHLALDDHLGRDAGMIGADHPARVLALQPRMADEDVLQRIVEGVADMEAARHIGRRVDQRPGIGAVARGAEQAIGFPMPVPAGFEFGGVEGLGQFGHALPLAMCRLYTQPIVIPARTGMTNCGWVTSPRRSPRPAACPYTGPASQAPCHTIASSSSA